VNGGFRRKLHTNLRFGEIGTERLLSDETYVTETSVGIGARSVNSKAKVDLEEGLDFNDEVEANKAFKVNRFCNIHLITVGISVFMIINT